MEINFLMHMISWKAGNDIAAKHMQLLQDVYAHENYFESDTIKSVISNSKGISPHASEGM